MQTGDNIVILEGAKMPFVIRQVGEDFLLVGPCYVEGISNGEPAAMARSGQMRVDDIRFI
jgi:hypothetical protein